MRIDDEVTIAQYAKERNLLDTKGWRSLKRLASRKVKPTRQIKLDKLRSFQTAQKYMYGIRVPATYVEALESDARNKNTKWADATALEMQQLKEYSTFINKGTYATHKIPEDFNGSRYILYLQSSMMKGTSAS